MIEKYTKIMQKKIYQGFSLLELMIAVVILSIILAIAIPAYQSYIADQNLELAKTQLGFIALKLEEYRTESGTYKGTTLNDLDLETKDSQGNIYSLSKQRSDNFLLSVTIPDNDICHTLSINAQNERQAVSTTEENTKNECWQ